MLSDIVFHRMILDKCLRKSITVLSRKFEIDVLDGLFLLEWMGGLVTGGWWLDKVTKM